MNNVLVKNDPQSGVESNKIPWRDDVTAEKIVDIGASAGGLVPIIQIVAAFPQDFLALQWA